jgi:hypothetical protein
VNQHYGNQKDKRARGRTSIKDEFKTPPAQNRTTVWGPDCGDEVEYLRVFVNQLRKKIEPVPSKPHTLVDSTPQLAGCSACPAFGFLSAGTAIHGLIAGRESEMTVGPLGAAEVVTPRPSSCRSAWRWGQLAGLRAQRG